MALKLALKLARHHVLIHANVMLASRALVRVRGQGRDTSGLGVRLMNSDNMHVTVMGRFALLRSWTWEPWGRGRLQA